MITRGVGEIWMMLTNSCWPMIHFDRGADPKSYGISSALKTILELKAASSLKFIFFSVGIQAYIVCNIECIKNP